MQPETLRSAAFGEQDYVWFATKVQAKFGVRLADYKPDQMKRRIASLADRCGTKSFADYSLLLEKDSTRLAQFLEEMTINVTELLRNPGLFDTLVSEVLSGRYPRRDGGEFKVWSAGCSYGAEAYTLAMLLSEKSPGAPFRIKGTDIDLSILARANNPKFSKEDMTNISPQRRKTHFFSPDGQSHLPLNQLRDRIQFT